MASAPFNKWDPFERRTTLALRASLVRSKCSAGRSAALKQQAMDGEAWFRRVRTGLREIVGDDRLVAAASRAGCVENGRQHHRQDEVEDDRVERAVAREGVVEERERVGRGE